MVSSFLNLIFVKKIFVLFAVTALIAACGSETEKKATPATDAATTAPAPANDLSSNPDYIKGLALVGKSDCLTCHKISDKLIGPSYKDVAAKYEATEENIAMLTGKIIKGGKGVWGEIPMTPHPQISKADATQMVKYIMLLKK